MIVIDNVSELNSISFLTLSSSNHVKLFALFRKLYILYSLCEWDTIMPLVNSTTNSTRSQRLTPSHECPAPGPVAVPSGFTDTESETSE